MNDNYLAVVGVLLTVGGPLLALYTGNIFGFSESVSKDLKISEGSSDRKHRGVFLYYKINERIRIAWPMLTAAGVVVLIISFL